jgi:hypothetical protein
MALLEELIADSQAAGAVASQSEDAECAARRTLRAQISRLERELADAFVTAFPMGGLEFPPAAPAEARLLDLAALEQERDELAERLRRARLLIAERAERQKQKRLLLEQMLLEPAKHRFARVSQAEIGEPGCGVWQVRPRFGLIGMLAGWWQVKLSSGCPLAGGRGASSPRPAPRPAAALARPGIAACGRGCSPRSAPLPV